MYSDSNGYLPFFALTAIIGAAVGAVVGGVKAAKSGESVWKGALKGAAVGGLIGGSAGAAVALIAAGSVIAPTAAVVIGIKAITTTIVNCGVAAASMMMADNISQAANRVPQVFWAGGENAANAANKLANEIGGITLEMTRIGNYLGSIGASQEMWRTASANFANVANTVGATVYSVQNIAGVGIRSIWATVEYPLLQGSQIIYAVVSQSGIIQLFR